MTNQSALHNIRILDFSWVLAGPYATRLLADFGAEVIKGQPLLPQADDRFSQGYYNTWNRNKLGITLNLDKAEGVALAKRLVAISDVVVENFSPRVMANWGLDYANLARIKPEIIMLSMSLMGQTGPCRNYTGFGPTVHALSGMTHLTSYPGQPPLGPGFAYADHVAGLYASLAILGALEHRRRTGEGQHIDLSEVEAMASLLGDAVIDFTSGAPEPRPMGNASRNAAPHNVYPCLGNDAWCAITIETEGQWEGFKRALGNPGWANDRRFATMSDRLRNMAELDRQVSEWTRQHTAREVMECMQAVGVGVGVVQDAEALANDPQLKARGFFLKFGEATVDANPIRLSETPPTYARGAPTLGQDNDYVYGELLGIGEDEIGRLRGAGVI